MKNTVIKSVGHKLRLNDTKIEVKGKKVFIADSFNDITGKEVVLIINYLENEGFIKNSKVEVYIQTENPHKKRQD